MSNTQWRLPKVPRPYVLVEYIESTGTQWIDTGVKQDKLNIHTKLRPLNADTGTYGLLIGGRESASSQVFFDRCPKYQYK